MKEDEQQKLIPGEEDENVGGEPPKKKEKRRKSKEERAADRRIIFWFMLIMILITAIFYIWPKLRQKGSLNWNEMFVGNRSGVKVNQEVIKEMEKPGWKPYTEIKF